MRMMCHFVTCASIIGVTFVSSSTVLALKPLALLATIDDGGDTGESAIAPGDVQITEDGRPASVLSVDAVRRVPKVQILIDNGMGVPAGSIGDLRVALAGLLDALPPTLEVTLVTTAPQPQFLEKATTDRVRLREAVNRLAPDSSAGRFVESLYEAVERIDKDREADAAYTIFTLGTTLGDRDVRESDVEKIIRRVQVRRTVVHAVILQTSVRAGGANQRDVADAVTRVSNGRLEAINATSRLVTLLPEFGLQISRTSGPGAKQVRILFERPSGTSGQLGQVSVSIRGKTLIDLALVDTPKS